MKQINLVNEYGSNYGVELIFDTYAEMREYEESNYGEEGFPQDSDVWNQLRVTVIEKNDPDSLKSRLEKMGIYV